jgi:hypothetical protein
MTRARLEAYQWLGLLVGPLAFAVQHVLGVEATLADCNPARLTTPLHPLQAGATTAAALLILAGEAAALLAFRATRDVEIEGDPPAGRIRFLATAALAIGPIFLTLVLLDGVGVLSHAGCRQS